MRILVCGGRTFGYFQNIDPCDSPGDLALYNTRKAQYEFGWEYLDKMFRYELPELCIDGVATGGDTVGHDWATWVGVPTRRFPADWAKHGKSAGSIRNQLMLFDGKPDLVIAFPGGRGTADMVRKARKASIEVIEVEYNA